MAEDIEKLVTWACSQGWTVEVDSSGYRRFYTPDGVYIARYPATPSNPRRRLLEVVTAARRNGLPWPPPSKKGTTRPAQEGWSVVSLIEWRVEVRIRITQEPGDRQLDQLMDSAAADAFHVVRDVEAARDPIGLTLAAYFLAPEPADVLRRFWASAQAWLNSQGVTGYIADGRVRTGELFEEEALRPDTPELLSAPDVAELLGVSRQRVHQLAERPDFPAPYARLGSGAIWTRPAVEAFDRRWARRPGRPARAAG